LCTIDGANGFDQAAARRRKTGCRFRAHFSTGASNGGLNLCAELLIRSKPRFMSSLFRGSADFLDRSIRGYPGFLDRLIGSGSCFVDRLVRGGPDLLDRVGDSSVSIRVDGLREFRPHGVETHSDFLVQAVSQRRERVAQPLVKFHQ
jgi:hypothetical protein